MHDLKILKGSLFETRTLLKQLSRHAQVEDAPPVSAPAVLSPRLVAVTTEAIAEATVDVTPSPLVSPTPFALPVRNKVAARGRRPATKRPPLFPVATPKPAKIHYLRRRAKPLAVTAIFLMIPVAFYFSYIKTFPRQEAISVSEYAPLLPLIKAHRVKRNLIGQVDYSWRNLSKEEREQQLKSLAEFIQADDLRNILLFYPDGVMAAEMIQGRPLIHALTANGLPF
jgi:hypothetical protein